MPKGFGEGFGSGFGRKIGKKSGKGMQTKVVPLQYDRADEEVAPIVKELIPKYHSHLVTRMDKIAYLFKNKKITQKGKEVAATAEKCSPKVKAFCDMDFVITISYEVWKNLSDDMKAYILDHELEHCGIEEDPESGEEILKILPHSFEDFTECVRRWWVMTSEIKKLQMILAEDGNKKLKDFEEEGKQIVEDFLDEDEDL